MRTRPHTSFKQAWAILTLALTVGLCGCGGVVDSIDQLVTVLQEVDTVSARPSVPLIRQTLRGTCMFAVEAGASTYKSALLTYARTRVVELEDSTRGPVTFGPWLAYDDFDAPEADPTGRLTQWHPDYYITHDWSQYGQQILTVAPGDLILINGKAMDVTRTFDYPKDSFSDEVRILVGPGVILQTCEPDMNLNRIVFGVWEED